MHIAIEGLDGAGKTTIAGNVAKELGFEFIQKPMHLLMNEKGNYDNFRNLLLSVGQVQDNTFRAMFLGVINYYLSILTRTDNIVTDRHLASNYYQFYREDERTLYDLLVDKCGKPDLTVILYAEPDERYRRIASRNPNDKDLLRPIFTDEPYERLKEFVAHYDMPYIFIDNTHLEMEDVVAMIVKEARKIQSKAVEEMNMISTVGLKKIGEGAAATVYELNEKQVLKAYKSIFTYDMIKKEEQMTQQALQAGINTMKCYEMVRTEDGYGIIYERLQGKTLLEHMLEDKENLEKYVRSFGEFVKKMHEKTLNKNEIGSAKLEMLELLENRELLDITEEECNKLKAIIELLPECDKFSHGDCHMGNVILQGDEMFFIDMGRMTCADPLIDFVSVFCQYYYSAYHGNDSVEAVSPLVRGFNKEERKLIWKTYLKSASGIEDENQLNELESQIDMVTSVRMLLVKHYNEKFFSESTFKGFVKGAVEYYEKGLKPYII